MSSNPTKIPQRKPPQIEGDNYYARNTTPTITDRPNNVDSGNLTTDAYTIQEQLDNLEKQFAQMRFQIRQAQKLATLGTTTATIAHEFNNLFTPIVAYAGYALDKDDVELMRKALARTLDNIAVMREMSDRIIGLAKQSDDVIKAVRIKDIVDNAIACMGRDFTKDNIELNIQIDSDLSVRANEGQLLQVLYNLIINARQSMLGRRGRLAVDAAPTGNRTVAVNVRDTGGGIAPEHLPHIFEAFFSTKQYADQPEKRGLGLGLTICRDIIEDLGGKIEVSSEKNVGTTFTITLPEVE